MAIAAGNVHNLALRVDGKVVAWGDNGNGQTNVPAGLTGVVGIAGGAYHSLALKGNGTVVGWGANYDNQISVPAGLSNVVAVAAGGLASLALKADGTVVGWGYGLYGQTNVPVGLTNVVAIAVGSTHSLALKADGTVTAWGSQRSVPAGVMDVFAIAASDGGFSLALKRDGTVVSWSANTLHTNVPVGLSNVVAIAAGAMHRAALKADGTVVAWGDNSYGQQKVPLGLTNVVAIAAGVTHNLVIRSSRPIVFGPKSQTALVGSTVTFGVKAIGVAPLTFSWRFNGLPLPDATNSMLSLTDIQFNQAGTYSVAVSNLYGEVVSDEGVLTVVPVLFADPPHSQDVLLGADASLTVGVEGIGPMSFQWLFNGVPIPEATNMTLELTNVQLNRAGAYSVVASNVLGSVTSPVANVSVNTVTGWGRGVEGQTAIPMGLTNVVALAAGTFHSLALKTDGSVIDWGTYLYAYSYNGSITNFPVRPVLTNAVAIAAGHNYSLALTAEGRVFGWGSSMTNNPGGLTNLTAIAAGRFHALGLRSDATVVAWGDNLYGQMNVPVGLTNVTAVAAGGYQSLALKADGTVVAWGTYYNYNGTSDVPVTVPAGLQDVVAIASGLNHSLALRGNGTVVAWGYIGTNSIPMTAPAGLTNIIAIAAGGYQSLALKADGTAVAWGSYHNGTGYVPVTVPAGLTGVVALAAGSSHILALITPQWSPKMLGGTVGVEGFEGAFRSLAGRRYTIEFTEDWVRWTPLAAVTATSSGIRFRDPAATGRAARFYRVRGD